MPARRLDPAVHGVAVLAERGARRQRGAALGAHVRAHAVVLHRRVRRQPARAREPRGAARARVPAGEGDTTLQGANYEVIIPSVSEW